jgi:hypothetical protein
MAACLVSKFSFRYDFEVAIETKGKGKYAALYKTQPLLRN